VVIKPAPEAPLSNFILAEALAEAGLPPGAVNVVPGSREVGEHLVTHPGTDKVAFTGSTAAGKRINGSYPPFPLVPFGGFRESGLGRELGPEGLQNFLEPRSIGLSASLR
jgi:acyl-CoA reductase-like NAD-dependent aldehyde dehydrogenase